MGVVEVCCVTCSIRVAHSVGACAAKVVGTVPALQVQARAYGLPGAPAPRAVQLLPDLGVHLTYEQEHPYIP